jgi:hypothetical protein
MLALGLWWWQQQQRDLPLSFDTGCWGSIALLRTGTLINLTAAFGLAMA